MSAIDQCRSGVVCLNYKDQNYIQANSRRATTDKSSSGFVKNVYRCSTINDKLLDGFGNGSMAVNDSMYVNIISSPTAVIILKRDVGVQWNINDITDSLYEIPKFLKHQNYYCLKKSVKTEIDGIRNEIFVPEITGSHFKGIVKEKITKEFRDAKCNVSSLPSFASNYGNCNKVIAKNAECHLDKKAMRSDYAGKLWSSEDCKCSPEIKKSGLSPGFVRQLINKFDVYDNVEQQCPRRKSL
ncbi:uncharacterized protein LOC113552647 [Rhopalosiphum maidis]|uniref:uncharacterized protein LOC113552647 n=1 Tax=Rhopalosiphum maidis TaxID=43146 RepID=UPI000F00B335|nr:uncharacterized protein LOC113552647 [Rhopalosiphum maidis]